MHQIETKAMFKNQNSYKLFLFCLFFSRISFLHQARSFSSKTHLWHGKILDLNNVHEFVIIFFFHGKFTFWNYKMFDSHDLKSWVELHVLRHDSFLKYLFDKRFIVFQILCTYIQMWLALVILLSSWNLYDFKMEYCFFLSLEVAKTSTTLDFF
jgi:hypothetical protein